MSKKRIKEDIEIYDEMGLEEEPEETLENEILETPEEISSEMFELQTDIQTLVEQLKEKSELYFHEANYHTNTFEDENEFKLCIKSLNLLLEELEFAILNPDVVGNLLKMAQYLTQAQNPQQDNLLT